MQYGSLLLIIINHQNSLSKMTRLLISVLLIVCLPMLAEAQPVSLDESTDFIRDLQWQAIDSNHATWGRWGTSPDRFTDWTSHSNRLIPVYTFGINLAQYKGENSIYRDSDRLNKLYRRTPRSTVNSNAVYLDQTDIYHLQQQAVQQGKKYIFLVVFDGMDWQTTRAAAIYRNRADHYEQGRGRGLAFQDYDKTETDFGFFVSSPFNNTTSINTNAQVVTGRSERFYGGYDPLVGGFHPWDSPASYPYLICRDSWEHTHAYTDSAASATSMTCGIKTFNGAINVDPSGIQVIPIARQLQEQGFSVGAVTSVPFSHATPACTYANNVSRADYQDISRDMLGLSSIANRNPLQGMDVVIGCGWGNAPETRSQFTEQKNDQGINYVFGNHFLTKEDLATIDILHGGRYQVAIRSAGKSGRENLRRASRKAANDGTRLFGFYGTDHEHLPYATANGDYRPARGLSASEMYSWQDLYENPTIRDMTEAALAVLQENSNGFWLLVESGDVDWANHDNNLDDSIGAVFSGEAAFLAIVNWIEQNECWDQAAVIVTADHGHLFVLEDPQALIPK